MNILLVDDEAPILRWVSRVLESCGHTVLAVAEASRAIDVLLGDRIDLLISDVCMPEMRGPELAAIARQYQPDVSILLMSGRERPDGFPFLPKPFQTKGLLVAVEQAVATCRTEVVARS
jgi:CheY-like chemotaxis protein